MNRFSAHLSLALVVVMTGVSPAKTTASNLVTNGDFENVGIPNYAGQIGVHDVFYNEFAPAVASATGAGGSLSQGIQSVTGWSTQGYHFLMTPGSATGSGAGTIWNDYLSFWGSNNTSVNPEDRAGLSYIPETSPTGGNFIALDGAYVQDVSWLTVEVTPGYWDAANNIWVEAVRDFKYPGGEVNLSLPLTQQVSGLEIGQEYELSFYWAAAQQFGYDGDIEAFLNVSFGDDVNFTTDTANLVSHGYQDWQKETITFTATSSSSALSFLAGGAPVGLPPFVFLDGIAVVAVPEPSSIAFVALSAVGLLALRNLRSRRRQDD